MARKKQKEWSESELIKTFLLRREDKNMPLLSSWLDTPPANLSEIETIAFQELLDLVGKKGDFWNEESLKMSFIAPLLHTFIKLVAIIENKTKLIDAISTIQDNSVETLANLRVYDSKCRQCKYK